MTLFDHSRFYGESPSHANPAKLNSVSLLEIVLKGNEQNQNMVVGLCQDNVILERLINEVFHLAMEGVPWLKFEKLCKILMLSHFYKNQKICFKYFNFYSNMLSYMWYDEPKQFF